MYFLKIALNLFLVLSFLLVNVSCIDRSTRGAEIKLMFDGNSNSQKVLEVQEIMSFTKKNYFTYENDIKRRLLNASFTLRPNGTFVFHCYGADNEFYKNVQGEWTETNDGFTLSYTLSEISSSVSSKGAIMYGYYQNNTGILELDYDYWGSINFGYGDVPNIQTIRTTYSTKLRLD